MIGTDCPNTFRQCGCCPYQLVSRFPPPPVMGAAVKTAAAVLPIWTAPGMP